ncbi:glycine--tRNA ligase subunit beta [Thermosipho atlanticus]|uniref:Glycine--tRNA ligase beta subunit n=1 Tax=Thermosipho atlanticus DSM 15807 TaxID=1123380 RepID=A0A1M5U084_9BACT|nr:glycine--tRNA ligase subunit beta [Thermosipho atlanticus]SHH56495.1 glycyl-tRNA synthetase beta chain [Thermosipho atlanticus DSM 15807]
MAEYLFEIGVEELPTTEVDKIVVQVKEKVENLLKTENLYFGELKTFFAPRRFGFFIKDLQEKQENKVIEKRGPSLKIAYDENMHPTKALQGFLASNGATLENVIQKDNYVFIKKQIEGKYSKEIFREKIPQIIGSLSFKKPMRWGNGVYSFVRIPHWILSIYNGEPLEFEIFGIKSSNKTYAHRFVKDEPIEIKSIDDYVLKLKEFKVIPFEEERVKFVKTQIEEFEKTKELVVEKDEELIEEVITLTEYPGILDGTFYEKYLALPEELITVTIKHHQRSFTTYVGDKITNKFVSFIDSPTGDINKIRKGYERVINARLEDARYYYEKDLKVPLESFNKKLKEIIFQKELGTLMDKVERIKKISEFICEKLKINYSDKVRILRTAELCKADIASNVVYEFPELQGIMGRIYAVKDNEDQSVALGIEDHYKDVPQLITGAVVALADRIDTIVGSFAVGNVPTGSKDPFGLRKKTDTIFKIVSEYRWNINLEETIEFSAKLIDKKIPEDLKQFFESRYELFYSNIRYDIARAVKSYWRKPYEGKLIVEALIKIVDQEEFQHLLIGFERVHNISKKFDKFEFDPTKFLEKEEKLLFNKYIEIKPKVLKAVEELNFEEALQHLISLRPYIDSYFDKVFVMTKQDDIRMNRLGFLKNLDNLFFLLGNLSVIEKKLN